MATAPAIPTAPSSTLQTVSTGPAEYVAPYLEDLLGRGQALTTQDPYQQYRGVRTAALDPLQQMAGWSVAGLNAGNLMSQGSNLTYAGAQHSPSTASFGNADAQQYMSPYQQNVNDIGAREAARQSNIQGNYDDGKAATAGAFGGTRQAIMDAERERNLGQQQQDIQQKGQNAAYQNAQAQYNTDQQRQQQDAQFSSSAAMQGGQALANQGQMAFNAQNTSGAIGQNYVQQQLNNNYSDFQGAVQHPYDQLTFMNNIAKGMPGSTSTSASSTTLAPGTQVAPPTTQGPNLLNQIGTGIGGITGIINAGTQLWDGVSSLFNEGGYVNHSQAAYAHGGEVVSGLPQARISQIFGSM